MTIRKVPFYRLNLSAAEIRMVTDVLKSGWLTTGKVTRAFEDAFALQVGSKYAVALNSGTAALHLSLVAAGIGAGDEVITTPYTFVASAEAIIHTGAKPVFVDTEPDSFNIDLSRVIEKITPRTRAILPVYIAGLPCDLRELERLRRRYRLIIIHDAAHALGASHQGRPVGSTSDYTCFSFYATKNLTTGEGGMVTVNSKKKRDSLRLLSLHGMSKGAWKRYSTGGDWRYQVLQLGHKYNMSDINAALGLAQLRRFKEMQQKRRRLVELYHHYLKDIDEIELPVEPESTTHAWHLYIIKLRKPGLQKRNRVIERLKKQSIGTSVHFMPLFLHPYYQKGLRLDRHDYPNSYNHYRRVITLPFYVDLHEREVKQVATALKNAFGSGWGK